MTVVTRWVNGELLKLASYKETESYFKYGELFGELALHIGEYSYSQLLYATIVESYFYA